MRSHRLIVTVLAAGTCAAFAGCGTGRSAPSFGADPSPSSSGSAVQAAPAPAPQPAAPVVVAGPDQKVVAERDAAAADAARSREAAAKADARRKAARKELRDERAREARARKRAAAREAFLRHALAAKVKAAGSQASAVQAAGSAPAPQHSAPITASDTSGENLIADRDRRSDAESRAAVVRFHELLDARDPRACDMLTPHMLAGVYGTGDDAITKCRDGVKAIDQHVSVVIAESRAHGRRASIAVVSKLGDTEVQQTLRLVLVDGTWLIDAAQPKPS